MRSRLCLIVTGAVLLAATNSGSAAPVIFSAGETNPESITPVPGTGCYGGSYGCYGCYGCYGGGYGDPTSVYGANRGGSTAWSGQYAGSYFVPDPVIANTGAIENTIWAIPASGGPPAVFAQLQTSGSDIFRDGVFLPPKFGAFGNDYIVGGETQVRAYTPNATLSILADTSALGYVALATPVVAPRHFGDAGGKILFSAVFGPTGPENYGGVVEIDRTGNVSLFASTPGIFPFGMAFAPRHFGSLGGDLFVSNSFGGQIFAIDGHGQSTLFTTIPNIPTGGGLRQLSFAPPGFGAIGGDLIVSVASGSVGGGSNGELFAVNSSGQVVAEFKTGGVPFDPRGVLFTPDGKLLISDTTDPILSATPSDFGPPATVPEITPTSLPAAISLLTCALLTLRDRRRSR